MGLASKMAAYAGSNQANSSSGAASNNPFLDSPSTSSRPPADPAPSQPAAASSTTTSAPALPVRQDTSLSIDSPDHAIPDEPPPAYTPAAGRQGDTHVQAGPSRMDFSGPPPMPERLEQNITGVGVGYGPRRDENANSFNGGGGFASPVGLPPGHVNAQSTGASGWNSHGAGPSSPAGLGPPPPPQRHSNTGSQQQGDDTSPTEVPTPGRPLLRNGMLLVYPKGHFCTKCGNTGYKGADPSNPHDADWRKYGKQFTSALAHSYTLAPTPLSNPSTTSATNFQRPLPNFTPHPSNNMPSFPARPPGGTWDHPGNHRPPPPPQMNSFGPPGGPGPGPGWGGPMMAPPPPQIIHGSGWVPANAMVVHPGDPRLGGFLCYRCRGNGRETDWLGFDDGKCWECRGVGRVFR